MLVGRVVFRVTGLKTGRGIKVEVTSACNDQLIITDNYLRF